MRRRGNHRRRVTILHRSTHFGDVIEIGEDLVELFLSEWIVLVVVAARATESYAKEHGGGGLHAVYYIFNCVFFRNNAVLSVGAMIAIEAGSNLLVEGGIGQHITGDLLERELIKRLVAIEGVDHPIAPAPHTA